LREFLIKLNLIKLRDKTMNKITHLALILMGILVVFGARANAQTPKRIEFVKGKSSATFKGNTGNYGVTYIIRAKSGQKLILNLTPAKQIGIKVETDGTNGEMVLLREERGGTYQIGLEESGDYTIFIGSTNHKPIPFTLTVKVGKMRDI
jgi:hypothetical protein